MPTRQFYLTNERDLKLQLLARKLKRKVSDLIGEAVDQWVDSQPEVLIQINGKEVK